MDEKLLQEIGLAPSEIAIYTALLKTGSTKAGGLVKEVPLHRSRVYEAINRLIEKGLVSYVIKNNVKFFQASAPERLLSFIEEQKEKLNEREESIKKILPELKKQTRPLAPQAEAHVLYGKEGFKTMRKDVLKQKQTLFLIGAVGKEDEAVRYFFPSFDRLRVSAKIHIKVLFDHEVRGKPITKLDRMEMKFLPKAYSSPAVINIYADRVVNVLWKGEVPICFMVINKDFADAYRKWFELIWKSIEG